MLLGLILLVAIVAVCLLFFHPPVWFPVAITSGALAYDRQFMWTLWVTGILFVAAQLVLIWILLRARKPSLSGVAVPTSGGIRASWLAAAAMIAVEVTLAAHGTSPLNGPILKNPETIEVYAHQFAWNFRYAGPDGIFGRVRTEFIADAGGNPVGIDPSDPNGADDIVTPTLRIPAGRDVRLLLRSRDVIHDFFVRELRTKQDIVPGMAIPLDVHADRPGQYEIACAELCGLGHNQMHSILIVMPPSEYDQWKLRR
jgi:cytochrome c oxidase subunit 2